MISEYYYCRLTPTHSQAFYYTRVFNIRYNTPVELRAEQERIAVEFMAAVGNPPHYNAIWSRGGTQNDIQQEKNDDINNVQITGGNVTELQFP